MKFFVIWMFLLLLLTLRFTTSFNIKPLQDGQELQFTTTLLSEPIRSGRFQRINATTQNNQTIYITTAAFPEYHYAQTLKVSGTVKKKVLEKNYVIFTMSFPKIEAEKTDPIFPLAIASFLRQRITALYQETLPPTSSSLLLGIVFGIKDTLPRQFEGELQRSGVFHVVAASGMNVTMTAGFLSALFAFFLRRRLALMVTIGGIFFYALLSGLEPSIVRASIMGGVAFSAQILGRQRTALYGLLLACYGMLFFSPMLIQDIGFQLSVLATLGLLFIQPLFARNATIDRIIKVSVFGEGFVTTIAAQAATLPILLGAFGSYSLWSILANTLVLWVIPTLMVLGGVGGLIGIVFAPLGKLILYLSLPFLSYFEKIIVFFASLGGVVVVEGLPWQISVGYFFLLTAFLFLVYKKK